MFLVKYMNYLLGHPRREVSTRVQVKKVGKVGKSENNQKIRRRKKEEEKIRSRNIRKNWKIRKN